MHRYVVSAWLILPAALRSGVVFCGHLITLDDDFPGEWSNPEMSGAIWHDSLRDLALKFMAFCVALALGLFAIAHA